MVEGLSQLIEDDSWRCIAVKSRTVATKPLRNASVKAQALNLKLDDLFLGIAAISGASLPYQSRITSSSKTFIQNLRLCYYPTAISYQVQRRLRSSTA